jgi:cadmium resistance protein CadD (predicted permease)
MSSPERVPVKLHNRVVIYLGIIFIGLPILGIWVFFHLSAIDLICKCVPYNMFPEWAPTSIWIAGLFTLIPLLFADWFVWTRWRSYRMEEKLAKIYAEKHAPWYTKTGDDRPTGPIKNKYYEP